MDEQPVKKCSRCGQVKPLTDFHARKSRPIGVASHCKACESVRCKQRPRQPRGHYPSAQKASLYAKAYRLRHPARVKLAARQSRLRHLETARAREQAYAKSAAGRSVKKRYLQTDNGALQARKYARQRRERKRHVAATFTASMEQCLRIAFGNCCFVTGESNTAHKVRTGQSLHVDHVAPLVAGCGLSFDNACLLSREVNSSKHVKTTFFTEEQQQRLRLLQREAANIYQQQVAVND